MKFLLPAAIVICFVFGTGARRSTAQTPDLSQFDLTTREGVNAAREAIGGRKLDNRSSNCVRFEKALTGIAVVGDFAYDRGCRFAGVFVDKHYFGKDSPGMSQAALNSLGWKTAGQEQREQMAESWVENGLLAFFNVLSETNGDFTDHAFHPPKAASQRDETIVTLWIRQPAGRTRGRTYLLREFRFSADGGLSGAVTRDTFVAQ
ncbi:MAG: hypothetical protein AABM67_14695 [Acidobacteriota bacterium]